MVQYVLGPAYRRLPGNNERFFLFYLALFVLAGIVGIRAWRTIELQRLPRLPRRRARLLARVLLPLAGLVVFARYIPALLDASSANPTPDDYRAGPTFFWTIALLDLGVGLPTLVTACAGLMRENDWARRPSTPSSAGWP
jgi:hypothetical protein